MNKKLLLGSVCLMLLFASASYAQTVTPSPTPTPGCPDWPVPKAAELDKRIRVTSKPNPNFDHDENAETSERCDHIAGALLRNDWESHKY